MTKISALLTARGNNTMKDKNIRPCLGKPLLYYPAMSAKKSKYIKEFYTSSDCEKILNTAQKVGYIPIKRPKEYSMPTSQHGDAIRHAIDVMEKEYNSMPDILVVLLGNCVTVKTEWIDECIEKIIKDGSITSVVPVFQNMEYHPYRALKENNEGNLEAFFDFKGKKISSNRQDLIPSYFLCCNFWVLNVQKSIIPNDGIGPWPFFGKKLKPYILDECFDVHNEEDIIKSERWLIDNDLAPTERGGGLESLSSHLQNGKN